MYYIVGLGNPGEKYQNTRHNVGWQMLDALVATLGLPNPVASSKYAGRISEGVLFGSEVALLYPDTFMNRSGSAVQKLVPKAEAGNLIVVYDDVDIPVGEIKISVGKGAGGHNGISSIIDSVGTKDFIRIRVGIAPKSFWTGKVKRPAGERMSRHVLGAFSRAERAQLATVEEQVASAVQLIIEKNVTAAMTACN